MNLDEEKYSKNPEEQVKKWSSFLKTIRGYLYQAGYSEVTTSSLVKTGAFESTIDPLKVKGINQNWELHTSPEMEMKRLLSKAKTDIFQITKCFRDDPDTAIHGKEFSMLEFYKVGVDYSEIIKETKDLIQSTFPEKIVFKEITIEKLFIELINLKLSDYPTKEKLAKVLRDNKILIPEASDTWEDLFFKIMVEKIEPNLEPNTAYIVKDYPSTTSVLSKQTENTFYSERFEIYWKGMELCNGCSEVTSLEILAKNFETENKKRKSEGREPHPFPTSFFQAMKDFPACSGVAIGLDRLFMC